MHRRWPSLVLLVLACCFLIAGNRDPVRKNAVAVRAENLTVQPSSGPVTHVMIHNGHNVPFKGTVRVRFPDGWKVAQTQHAVALAPGETKRIPYAIERAVDVAANLYPVEIAVEGNGATSVHKQNVVCASAPYYKPKTDGDLKEWNDSIPIALTRKGKKAVVRTYWNQRQFCLGVEVEEDKLIPYKKGAASESPSASPDAVQFALAPATASRDVAADAQVERYEFLAVASSGLFSKDKCFQLLAPGARLSQARETRKLEGHELEGAQVVVKRKKSTTRYEIAVPYSAMPTLRPTTGRSFFFSVVVHDPDGTGIRNLGEVMNLFPRRRHPYGWCRWQGAKWGEEAQLDARCEWGLASSIH
jgi:hypothetical protein